MAKYAMLINPNNCTGCNACRIACQMQWSLPPELYFNRLEEHLEGKYPALKRAVVPVQCQHCVDPPCRTVCPTHATYKRADGIVLVDPDKCIGCKYCIAACPYDVRMVTERGLVEKCSFCAVHVDNGEIPACVSTCMCEVRTFGDLEDPQSELSQKIASSKVINIQGTSMYYVLPEKIESDILPPACVSPLHVNVVQNVSHPVSKGIMALAGAAVIGAAVVSNIKGGDKNNE